MDEINNNINNAVEPQPSVESATNSVNPELNNNVSAQPAAVGAATAGAPNNMIVWIIVALVALTAVGIGAYTLLYHKPTTSVSTKSTSSGAATANTIKAKSIDMSSVTANLENRLVYKNDSQIVTSSAEYFTVPVIKGSLPHAAALTHNLSSIVEDVANPDPTSRNYFGMSYDNNGIKKLTVPVLDASGKQVTTADLSISAVVYDENDPTWHSSAEIMEKNFANTKSVENAMKLDDQTSCSGYSKSYGAGWSCTTYVYGSNKPTGAGSHTMGMYLAYNFSITTKPAAYVGVDLDVVKQALTDFYTKNNIASKLVKA